MSHGPAPAKSGGGGSHGGGGGGSAGKGSTTLFIAAFVACVVAAIGSCGRERINGQDKVTAPGMELSATEWKDGPELTALEGRVIVVARTEDSEKIDCEVKLDGTVWLTSDPALPPYDGRYGVWSSYQLRGLPLRTKKQYAKVSVFRFRLQQKTESPGREDGAFSHSELENRS